MNKHSFFKLLPILFLLQGCYVYTTGLLAVESEPLEMKTVKTISYNEIETSIIAQRANKIVKEQLRKSGWKIVYKDNGDYRYTISTLTGRDKRLELYASNYGSSAREIIDDFAVFRFVIYSTKTNHNIREVYLTIPGRKSYYNIPNVLFLAKEKIMSNVSVYGDIECVDQYTDSGLVFPVCDIK